LSEKQARLRALENQIKRLQRRIDFLDRRSNRIGWIRVAIFITGALLSVLAYFLEGWWLFLIGIAITLTIFSVVAYFHGRIDRGITRHKIWMRMQSAQVARINLDWERIPPAGPSETQTNHPFQIDLDITGKRSLHQLINTAISSEGSQRLQDWLLNTRPDLHDICKRHALIQELTPLTIFRDKLLMKSLLASNNAANAWEGQKLLHWLNEHSTSRSLLPLLFVSFFLSVLTITLFVLNLLALIPQYWVIALLLTILFLFVTKNQRGDLFEDAYYLRDTFAQFSTIFEYLERYRYGKHSNLKHLCEPFFQDREHRPSTLLNKIARIASAATLQKNLLLWIIINTLVPWDFYFAHSFNQYKSQVAAHLPVWLDVWFELEALNSLANFAYLNPEYTLPAIVSCEDQEDQDGHHMPFRACALGHPLIPAEQKVVNDFAINHLGEIDIITGSNMSGKSTFLRTLGINLCLAYAGGPVNASQFQTSLFRMYTCIKISDSVTEGYSYFYAEVKRLKALLTGVESEDNMPLFFLIDEIFKGTNNRERRIGSESYISALVGRHCLGVISTHDLELVKLADKLPDIRNYHFKEDVINGQMAFDYILRPGPCPTTNALKIMQMEGLPVDVRSLKDA
jgi:ABC-type multidrug transport system fused ATPase/permease subunit